MEKLQSILAGFFNLIKFLPVRDGRVTGLRLFFEIPYLGIYNSYGSVSEHLQFFNRQVFQLLQIILQGANELPGRAPFGKHEVGIKRSDYDAEKSNRAEN